MYKEARQTARRSAAMGVVIEVDFTNNFTDMLDANEHFTEHEISGKTCDIIMFPGVRVEKSETSSCSALDGPLRGEDDEEIDTHLFGERENE